MIAIGTSLGGIDTLTELFSYLPVGFPVPIAVVIHRGTTEFDYLIDVLQKSTRIAIVEAHDKLSISPDEIVIAPADYHLLVDKHHYAISIDAPVQFARPSIDVLFESVADQYGAGAVGVILTGGGCDGVYGAGKIKSRGGAVLVQHPSTAQDPGLPQAALDAGMVADNLSIAQIARRLIALSHGEYNMEDDFKCDIDKPLRRSEKSL